MAPSKDHIASVFSHFSRGDPDGFFEHVDPNVGTYPEMQSRKFTHSLPTATYSHAIEESPC